jgi:hypothetical protein
MSQLTYLIDEVCARAEIYFTGRQGGQYLKTAFILLLASTTHTSVDGGFSCAYSMRSKNPAKDKIVYEHPNSPRCLVNIVPLQ